MICSRKYIFAQAADLVENERPANTPTASRLQRVILSPPHLLRQNTSEEGLPHTRRKSLRWHVQQTIRDCEEKSIQLEIIPGLLTIQKMKPRQASKSTRVTQVHGSMEGKEVVKVVKRINEAKDKCLAVGLKECPSCHSILHSICSKASCKVNGKKPEMISPAADMCRNKSR